MTLNETSMRRLSELIQQGRFWCPTCKVLWTGAWPISLKRLKHDCGTYMERTGGDERADPEGV